MKISIIMSALLLNFSLAYAWDSKGPSSKSHHTGMDNLSILTSGEDVRYLKNPCAKKMGYAYNQYRGFSFEQGLVKKLHVNGKIVYERKLYDNLHSFLVTNNVCATNKTPKSVIDYQSLEIWQ